MNQDQLSAIIRKNLAIVENHFELEARDLDEALKLYTDDIVWESPLRRAVYRGKKEIREHYLRLFASMKNVVLEPLERFATADRVVDDTLVKFTLIGDGFVNAPVRIGSNVELRLVHIFEMRDGKIAKEKVFEMWREI